MAQKGWKKLIYGKTDSLNRLCSSVGFYLQEAPEKIIKQFKTKYCLDFTSMSQLFQKMNENSKDVRNNFGMALKKANLNQFDGKIPKNSKTPNLNTHIEFIYFYRPSLIAIKWNSNTSIGWHVNIFCMHVFFSHAQLNYYIFLLAKWHFIWTINVWFQRFITFRPTINDHSSKWYATFI